MESAPQLTPDLLLSHEAFVLRLARSLVRDEAAAHDLAQDAFVAALEHRPHPGALRSWFAKVLRNRATEVGRAQQRRSERERRAARPEAQCASISAAERLELEHGVVAAVLALEEPYRGVVIGVYFEGLSPSEFAARRGVPAATVRSQLTRALEKLRARLDGQHGGRGAWSAALLGLLEGHESEVAAAGSGAGWLVGGILVATLSAISIVAARTLREDAAEAIAAVPAKAPLERESLAAPYSEPERAELAAPPVSAPSDPAGPQWTLADVPALRTRLRQVRKLILDRALEVQSADRERFAWLAGRSDAGLVRLLERNQYGERFDLPWMREGGAYYSFTERVHDYNRRPQVCLQDGVLQSVFHGGSEAYFVELGTVGLASAIARAGQPWPGLDVRNELAWAVAWQPIDGELRGSGGALGELWHREIQRAFDAGRIGASDLEALYGPVGARQAEVRTGMTYLLRCRSLDEHDVVVALEVASVTPDGCTLAWRLLDRRALENERPLWRPEMLAEDLPPPPAELAALSEEQLRVELDRLIAGAEAALFEDLPEQVEQRHAALRGRADAGLVRLVAYLGPWSELCSARFGGAMYALTERRHAAQRHDIQFEGGPGSGSLNTGFSGYDTGAVLHLGEAPFESLDLRTAARAAGELGEFVVTYAFPLVEVDPAAPGAGVAALRSAEARASSEFQRRLQELGGYRRAPALLGHTYLLRAVCFGERDVLALLHVAALDEYGVILAWRLLDERPVNRRR